MQSFKDLLNESMSLPSKYAKNVVTSDRAAHAAKGQIGSLHYAHGSDFDVYAPDSHDLAYFGKNVVRLKGKTTGKEQAAYVDWQKGTVSFYSGNHGDDKDFDKPVKFKTATLFKEAEENLDLYNQLAEDLEVSMPIDESEQTLVKGKIYKAASNDMLLKYTGRSKAVGTSFQPVFTVVDSKGVPRLVKGKKFTQSYGSDVLKNLSLVEAEHKLERDVLNTLKGIKADLASGKRTVKKIADECSHFEKQTKDEYAKSVFARLADCKNRKEFETVLNSLPLNESEEDLNEAAKSMRDKVIAHLVKGGSNEADATKVVDKNLADAMKVRPGATPAKLAEVIMSL